MKYQASKLRKLAASGAAGLAFVQSLQAVTVLTGTGDPDLHNQPVPASHGSNAPGTPDITLLWAPATGSPSPRWESYDDWDGEPQAYQLDYLIGDRVYNGSVDYTVAFTPSLPTVAVILTSITLNNWVGGSNPDTTLNWSITGSISGLLGGSTGVLVSDGSTQDLFFNGVEGIQGLGGETLTLTLTPTGGRGSYFAVDNLTFDQITIPEPSGAVLAATGLGALALRRRRK